jgi:hypothetical protein
MVMVSRGLDNRELAGSPRRGITYNGKVMEKQLGMTTLSTDTRPEWKFAPAT